MKKIQILLLAAFAVFAISAVASGTAFAETELLLNGEPVKIGDEILAEGSLALTDLTSLGEATVTCSGFLHGTISSVVPNDLLITEALDLENNLISSEPLVGLAFSCTGSGVCVGLAEVWPENLPWLAEILLSGTTFLFHLTEDGNGVFPAYDVLCTNTFGLMSDDLCEGLVSGVLENMAGESDVLGIFNLAEQETNKELANCEIGGTEKGHIAGEFLLFEEGFTLAVS